MSKETITLNISGMTCVNCSNAVEKVTKKMKGVEDATVSFASSKGEFVVDLDVVSKEEVVAKIKKLGYGVANDVAELEAKKAQELTTLKRTFGLSLFLLIGIIALEKTTFLGTYTMGVILVLASIVQFYCGRRFYTHAYGALRNKNYDMNVLVALGTSAAYGYSAMVVLFPNLFEEHLRYIYFMGSATIITFILLGKYLEERSKAKATDFLKKLMDLSPDVAVRLNDDTEEVVRVEMLQIGDIVRIKSGEKVSADGVVVEGEADIDTSMITGEPLPMLKSIGDDVIAGTIAKTGYLKVRVTKRADNNLLSHIVALLGDAQNQKMPIGRFADKVANIFVPAVILASMITFVLWYVLSDNFLSAFLAATAVLIISCPCALGLATPIAIISAVGKGATHGILIKNPEVLEIIKDIKYAIFDKTGTLTKGIISIKECVFIDDVALRLIASAEVRSEHPISKAVVLYAQHKNLSLSEQIDAMEVLPGKGIKAMVEGHQILVGSVEFLEEEGARIDTSMYTAMQKIQEEGNGAIIASINGQSVGYFSLQDALKEDAKEMVLTLKNKGIIPIMLTGDNERTAKSVAKTVGIDLVYAQVLPHEKFEVIKQFQADAKVLFVGDGINDSPSLKQSDIGIALSSGSDIAKDAGDIVLINNELDSVTKSINLSYATMRTIKQNLFWAFIYNVIGIPLAAGVFYPSFGIMLTPMYAGIAMSFSSVSVVLNSLR
ncbi:MAG: heavy metal translocating P-type ATPase, partial [Sulfurospirillaceae bacterium]|nr:heavy metal translocating P-type ATPase [Sulfurospirillaceae bacterium]